MDPHGRIYRDDNAPAEDKARLEGYLNAKAEQGEKEIAQERLRDAEAELEREERRRQRDPNEHPRKAF